MKPLYKFGYWVHDPKTHDVKNHWEHRDGDVVHGSYSLLQPDGHVRVVEYTADKHSGFNAHVRYAYEGGHGGGGGGGGDDFHEGGSGGAGYNGHLEDVSGRNLQQIDGGASAGHLRQQQPLNKFYKKPRAEKPGGPPGQYKKPHFEHRPKSNGGGGGGTFKKLRGPELQSAERYTAAKHGPNPFEQAPKFGAAPERYHGATPERYHHAAAAAPHGHPSAGGSNPFGYADHDRGHGAAEQFAREYAAVAAAATSNAPAGASPSSTERATYFAAAGIQHQSSEQDPVYHDLGRSEAATVTGDHYRGTAQSAEDDGAPRGFARSQRSHEHADSGPSEHGDHDDDAGRSDESEAARNHAVDKADDDDEGVKIQKQTLKEYHFEEPYPFEIPENVDIPTSRYRLHQKRHLPVLWSPHDSSSRRTNDYDYQQ